MRTNTLVMLVIAVIFGSIAVYIANIWLANQERQAAQVAPAANVETSTIVVASTNLPFGSSLTTDNLREIPWPRTSLPEGSFATITEITSSGRRVALSPISPNEPILKWKVSGPDARASLSAVVTAGMRAVAVRVNDVVGVGGFVLPGDRVDVLYTRGGGNDEDSSTDILIQNVRVLAIDQLADEKSSDPVIAKVATLEVTTLDAQKIALAQTTGSLSLTLRSAGSLDRAPAQRIVEQELVSSPSVYQSAIDAQTAAQTALNARLKELENRIASGEGDEALLAKLAQLEAELRDMNSASQQPVVVTPASDVAVVTRSTTVSVGVTRGVQRQIYEVPLDITYR